MTVTATLDAAAGEGGLEVAVAVGSAGDSAAEGDDYGYVADFTLTIEAGMTRGEAKFTLEPVDDDIDEETEILTITGLTGIEGLSVTGAAIDIADNDRRGVEVSPAALTLAEGDIGSYGVALTSQPTGTVTITPSAGSASEISLNPTELNFTPENWSSAQSVTVSAGADADDSRVTVSNAVSGADYASVKADSVTVAVLIEDDEEFDFSLYGADAWQARFGRTAADQVLRAVEGRAAAGSSPGTQVQLGGMNIAASESLDALPGRGTPMTAAGTPMTWGFNSGQPGSLPAGFQGGRQFPGTTALSQPGAQGRGVQPGIGAGPANGAGAPQSNRLEDFLAGSSFETTTETDDGGMRTYWGHGAITRFDGRGGGASFDGVVRSAMLGADWTSERVLAGLLLSSSSGSGGFRSPERDGEIDSSLTGIYPWASVSLNERVTVTGVAGYGRGKLTLTPEDAAPIDTDTSLAMAAADLRGVLLRPASGSGLELAVNSDLLLVRTGLEEARNGMGSLQASDSRTSRLRLGLEGSWQGIRTAQGSVVPALELGIRHDSGDAETGFGADIGAGVDWNNAALGIATQLRVRGLLTHQSEGIEEFGVSASIVWDPTPDSFLGPALSVTQSAGGQAAGGMEALLEGDAASVWRSNGGHRNAGQSQFEASLGYGLRLFGGSIVGIPELTMEQFDESREFSLGWRMLQPLYRGRAFSVGLRGGRLESPYSLGGPGHSYGLDLTWQIGGGAPRAPGFHLRIAGIRTAQESRESENRIALEFRGEW